MPRIKSRVLYDGLFCCAMIPASDDAKQKGLSEGSQGLLLISLAYNQNLLSIPPQ